MPDAGRQMWKMEFQKCWAYPFKKYISGQKQSNNARKETQKKNEEGKWNEKKNRLKWRETK